MQGNILVTTQELMNASSEFQARNTAINDVTGQMLTLARGLNSQWEGESATAFINRFNELEDDMLLAPEKDELGCLPMYLSLDWVE